MVERREQRSTMVFLHVYRSAMIAWVLSFVSKTGFFLKMDGFCFDGLSKGMHMGIEFC